MSNFIVKDGKISQENNQLLGKKRKIVENDITKTLYNLNKNPEIFKLLNNKENEIISRGIEYKLSHTLKGENIINDLTDKTKISKEETKNFIFNEDLMNSLMNWKSSSSIGKGLINLGNTCFLNSVLQSILYTPIIKNYLYLTNHKSICKSKNVCFLCELQKLYLETGIIKLIKENSRNSNVNYNGITPKGIIQNLKIISKNIKKGRQEDAHEFLLYLLDALENSVKQFLLSLNIKNHNFIRNEKLYRDNLISQIFGGKLKSSVVCQNCKESSDKYDNFIDLSLDILNTETIEKSFSKFCKPEELGGNNKYFCEKCKARHNSIKKLSFEKFPRILIIHLKRFDNFGRKIKKYIKYDNDLNLNFLKNNINANEDIRYKLYAVLIHEGFSTFSGHYYCYVKNSNDIWYCMNDSDVRQVQEKNVLNQTPYLLFYERVVDKKKYMIENHICQIKNQNYLESNKMNGTSSESTTDSDIYTEPIIKKYENIKINRSSSISNDIIRNKSNLIEFDNELTRSISLNVFLNDREIPRFVSKNMKRLLKLKNLQRNRMITSSSSLKMDSFDKENTDINNDSIIKHHSVFTNDREREKDVNKNKPNLNKSNSNFNYTALKEKVNQIYGGNNIELWDDDDDENTNVKKQLSFVSNEKLNKFTEVLKKDDYDIDYDKGKLKKIKKKKQFNKTNFFQKRQNRSQKTY